MNVTCADCGVVFASLVCPQCGGREIVEQNVADRPQAVKKSVEKVKASDAAQPASKK